METEKVLKAYRLLLTSYRFDASWSASLDEEAPGETDINVTVQRGALRFRYREAVNERFSFSFETRTGTGWVKIFSIDSPTDEHGWRIVPNECCPNFRDIVTRFADTAWPRLMAYAFAGEASSIDEIPESERNQIASEAALQIVTHVITTFESFY
jgi:hypothetical protein